MTVFQQPDAGQFQPPIAPPAGSLASTIIDTVKHAAATAPRSQQAAVGPSELGTPCTRRLGYKTLDWDPKPNKDTDPWASTIGTAVHAWMADAYTTENTRLGYQRYLIEQRVPLPGLANGGSCDLYDRATGTVIDWKVTSLDRIRKYRTNGPGQQYTWQAHLYGLGMQIAGEDVRDVAIVFLPRGGRIDGLHVWAQPYDPATAITALKRYETIRAFHLTVNPETHPGRWALLPTADAYCTYCPWFLPGSTDLGKGCPGHQPPTTPKEKN